MPNSEDHGVDAFVLRSDYRADVLAALAREGPATPTDLAERTGYRQPHISRTLSELRDRNVVELLVPEDQQRGRRYGLSDRGTDVWERCRQDIQGVDWSFDDPETESEHALLDLLHDEFGDALRMVGLYDGDHVTILYATEDAVDEYTDAEFERALRRLVRDYSLDEMQLPQANFRFEMKMFERFSLLRVRTGTGIQASASFEADHDLRVPSFARRIAALFS
ncbi:MarR family transcriptional regulator [Salarchaeum sp. III]|uniref:MarR family transcriptional regulator n=1 Tax=Salarchaeum sp. III TaxID=3107927 RepID=UPI002ED90D7B